MSFVDDLIRAYNDLERRLSRIERLDVNPPASFGVTYSGTPAASVLAYWTGAGTIAGAGSAFYDSANGRLGVGGNNPVGAIEAISVSTSATRGISSSQHNSGAQAAVFNFFKSRGNRASQTIVANGDFVGGFTFQPYDGTAYMRTAQIAAKVVGAVSAGTIPTDILFAAGNNDDASLTNVRMTVKSTGLVGIGVAAPGGQLQVEQASTTAAIPTLWLRQADVSEEFIRFEATVSAGNSLNTTALGTYYGRVRVYVEGVGEKWIAVYST